VKDKEPIKLDSGKGMQIEFIPHERHVSEAYLWIGDSKGDRFAGAVLDHGDLAKLRDWCNEILKNADISDATP
jgi:hypothetical protein